MKNVFRLDDIKYPYQFSGFTVYQDKTVCNKCGVDVGFGIANITTHWNDCINGGKLLSALTKLREDKGSELTVEDIEPILNTTNQIKR